MTAIFLIVCIGIMGAADLESYEFIDALLALKSPAAPFIFQDAVIFTAPSSYRRVGISFEYEGFSKVYWLKNLMLPKDPAELASQGRNASPNYDSGILFHVQTVPDNVRELDYRMVIDGLWTPDPLNPFLVTGSAGIYNSRVIIPVRYGPPPVVTPSSTLLCFTFNAPPGEFITVGGNFNNWDPFMYSMKESPAGVYTLVLDLPPGIYQYVFFYRGERHLDPNNPDKIFTKDGKSASQAVIRDARR